MLMVSLETFAFYTERVILEFVRSTKSTLNPNPKIAARKRWRTLLLTFVRLVK